MFSRVCEYDRITPHYNIIIFAGDTLARLDSRSRDVSLSSVATADVGIAFTLIYVTILVCFH